MPDAGKRPAASQENDQASSTHSSHQSPSPAENSHHIHWSNDVETGSPSQSHLYLPDQDGQQTLRHRRSSIRMQLDSITHAGGVNSIANYARSWQRAAGFYEITPLRPSFRFTDEGAVDSFYNRQDVDQSPEAGKSLLRQHFESHGRKGSDNAIADAEDDGDMTPTAEYPLGARIETLRRRMSREGSIFSIDPSLASPFAGSYGTTYGSLAARTNESSMRHAAKLYHEQQLKGVTEPDKERAPLLVKQVEEDGVKHMVVVGQSTIYQTIFNSVNVLIGVGLLSLPLAFKYSGWVIGLTFFIWSVLVTQYTAKLLAKCLDVDSSLITFADLAYVSFGSSARIATSILFSLELVAANVALIILFGDSLDALVPGWGVEAWKIVCGLILIPLSFLPLRLLSFTSILGILSCLAIVLTVIIDGLIKPDSPGSLLSPAKTYLFPLKWTTVPLAFGLLMSPWGGHSVFPNIYRDMRHPYKYTKGLNVTYIFTFFLDLGMAAAGLLMFGDEVRDEITSNVLLTPGYPKALSVLIVVAVAIIPLTKVPLNARPIVSTLEVLFGLDARALSTAPSLVGISGWNRGIFRATIRILVTILFVGIAVVFPSFDRIMTLLGSVCCFTICIILPLAFHLKLFGKEISSTEKIINWVLIVISSIMAVVSTVFACLPKELLGA